MTIQLKIPPYLKMPTAIAGKVYEYLDLFSWLSVRNTCWICHSEAIVKMKEQQIWREFKRFLKENPELQTMARDDKSATQPLNERVRIFFHLSKKDFAGVYLVLQKHLPQSVINAPIDWVPYSSALTNRDLFKLPDWTQQSKLSPLATLVDAKAIHLIPYLKERGCDLNTLGVSNNTPLMWSVKMALTASTNQEKREWIWLAQYLLKNGANPSITSEKSEATPLHKAAKDPEIFTALCPFVKDMDMNIRDKLGETPLEAFQDTFQYAGNGSAEEAILEQYRGASGEPNRKRLKCTRAILKKEALG